MIGISIPCPPRTRAGLHSAATIGSIHTQVDFDALTSKRTRFTHPSLIPGTITCRRRGCRNKQNLPCRQKERLGRTFIGNLDGGTLPMHSRALEGLSKYTPSSLIILTL